MPIEVSRDALVIRDRKGAEMLRVPLAAIDGVFIDDSTPPEEELVSDALVIVYRSAGWRRRRVRRFFVSPSHPAFASAIGELRAARPDADLTHLSPEEAAARLGVRTIVGRYEVATLIVAAALALVVVVALLHR